MPSAGLATTAVITPTAPPMFPATGVSPDESGRSMGLGPHPISGASHPNRSLRMVNLNRWLFHMWNRDTPSRNPNLPRSFVAAVCSGMGRDASAPPGSGQVRPATAAPMPSEASSSGGAPGFAPGVFPPVIPSSSAQSVMPNLPQQTPAPGQQQQQMYQMPQQFFQQQPMYHAPPGYMQQMAPVYSYQPAGPFLQQSHGHPTAVQPMAFNAGLANSAAGVQTGNIRPRKPKGGKGNRPKNRAGNAPIIAAPPTLPYHGVQGAPAFVSGPLVTAAPLMAPAQQQHDVPQAALAPGVNTVMTKLWCTKCQSAGHVASDCETQQYCFICNKANHPMTTRRCPALKMPKPAAMLCGYGTESMAFFQMPDNVCRADLAPQSSPTALVSISGGSISSSIVEAEVAKIAQYQQQWTWEAIPHGQNAFIMSFPSDEVLLRVTGFTVFIKSHNVTLEFKACHSEEIPNRFELIPVWVHVHGVPHALRHFLGLWAVGSVIGATLDVDLLCLRRRGIVKIQVGVLNLDAFKMSPVNSLLSEVVVQKKGYEFRYTLEDDDFRVDADFVPRVWEHGDDTEGDKEHDREDTSRADDKSKRPKASSSSANTEASSSLGGVVPMQITSSTTVPASTHPCLASRPLSGDPPAATELVPPRTLPRLPALHRLHHLNRMLRPCQLFGHG